MNAMNAAKLGPVLATLTQEFSRRAAEHDRDGTFPQENFVRLHEFGLLALTVPADHGGAAADLATAARVIAAVARAEPATALVLAMQYLSHKTVVPGFAPALQTLVWRDAVLHGGLMNALRVEPELGTPARGGMPATIGRRTATGWRISGHKLYSTGIQGLRWLSVWGRTDEPEPRVGIFLVPRDTPGIRIVESWDHLGMRATVSHDVIFDDADIPAEYAADLRAPAAWATERGAEALSWMIVLLGTLYDSVARASRDWLVRYLTERAPSNLGASLSTLPRFQEAVGDIDSKLLVNRSLLERLTYAADRGAPLPLEQSLLIKHVVTTNVIDTTLKALELTGNPGLSRNNPLERHYRNALCSRIHTPQSDAILATAGKAAFADLLRSDAA
jgi:alkylation response protein AidB-like acyl-CoA dehydrogenase